LQEKKHQQNGHDEKGRLGKQAGPFSFCGGIEKHFISLKSADAQPHPSGERIQEAFIRFWEEEMPVGDVTAIPAELIMYPGQAVRLLES